MIDWKNYIPFTNFVSQEKLKSYWDELLPKFGYDKNINVCSLPEKHLHDIYELIAIRIERNQ